MISLKSLSVPLHLVSLYVLFMLLFTEDVYMELKVISQLAEDYFQKRGATET